MTVKFSSQAYSVALLSGLIVFAASAAPVDTAEENSSVAAEQAYQVPNEKVKELMQRGRYLERQILVRQKNANERNDANSHQYSIGYKDGYNKAVLDLLKAQLMNGVELPNSNRAPVPAAPVIVPPMVPVNPQLSRRPPQPAAQTNSSSTPMTQPVRVIPASPPAAPSMSRSSAPSSSAPTAKMTLQVPVIVPAAPAPGVAAAPAPTLAPTPAATPAATPSPAVQAKPAPTLLPPSAGVAKNQFPGKEIPLVDPAPVPAAPATILANKRESFEQLMAQSTRALEQKQWQRAADYAGRAIAIKNDVASSYINRSWALGELGDTRQALIDANLAIQLQPKMGLAYNNRAYTYELMNNLPEARNDYQRACSLGFKAACAVVPKVDQVLASQQNEKRARIQELTGKSEALIQSRDWKQLIQVSSAILQLNPKHAGAYINRAWARAESGQLEQSLADAGKAIIINPSDPVAYNNRAYTYELMNDLRSARRDYAKACELRLKSACEVVAKIDQIQKRSVRKPTATSSRKTKTDSKKEQISQLISSSFEKFREGNWHEVEQLSNKVLKLDPRNALAYVNRGGARTEMGLIYNALDDIEKAIQLNPKLGIAYNNKAYVLEKMGDRKKAAVQYQKACKLGLQQSCKEFRRLTGKRN